MARRSGPLLLLLVLCLAACGRAAPPSQFPSAQALLDRLHATQSCSRGLSGEGKIDYFGDEGRLRGSLLFLTSGVEKVRLDVVSPFGATISTLTSDGAHFGLYDLRQKVFLRGPANACNLARFTHVPLPPHALSSLLRGEPPVLAHQPSQLSFAWEGGRYVVRVQSTHEASELISLSPLDEDYARPFAEQRLDLQGVEVRQGGALLYRASLAGHERARTAAPREDPEGLDPTIMPSGPACEARLPRRLRLEVPADDRDLLLSISQVLHNPPLRQGVFEQSPPGGVALRSSPCVE